MKANANWCFIISAEGLRGVMVMHCHDSQNSSNGVNMCGM